jgi:hypothetical protein
MQDETTRSRCHRLSTYRLSRPLPEIGAFLDSITSNTGKLRLTEILLSLRLGWRALETTPRGIDLKKPWDMEGKVGSGEDRDQSVGLISKDMMHLSSSNPRTPSRAVIESAKDAARVILGGIAITRLLAPLAARSHGILCVSSNVPKRACQMCKNRQPDIVASSNQDVQNPPPHPNTALGHLRSKEAPSASQRGSQKCKSHHENGNTRDAERARAHNSTCAKAGTKRV